MLFFPKYLKDLDSVRNEVERIIAKQKSGSPYDVLPFKARIEELMDSISDFNANWNNLPVVFRIARIVKSSNSSTTPQHYVSASNDNNNDTDSGGESIITYQENIVLPDTKHDLELVIKMLNYMREQKKLKRTDIPLFIHPDEILIAYRERKIAFLADEIQAQMTIIFQKGSIRYVGFVFGRDYVILKN
ncbi:MAG TPA: hypothetical protein VJ695_05645 [Nitrososphaera sp.]|nr:hypothetical protein [Nitrososphaera sp.]